MTDEQMSLFDDDEEPEDEDEVIDVDPATVAFLDQESAAFAEMEDQFESTYGFKHHCTCAQDYAEGKISEVTYCFLGLANESLDACARLYWESRTLRAMLEQMLVINNDLMDKMEEAGLGKELEEYLSQELTDLDKPAENADETPEGEVLESEESDGEDESNGS